MTHKIVLFLISNVFFVTCYSAFVDHLTKCGINDGACQRKLLQNILRDIGKTGVQELGIPPIDPYVIKNVDASILGLVEIGMVDGVAKGIKECVVDKFETNIDTETSVMELTCDLIIKGRYHVKSSSPLIKNLLGGSDVHGDGFGKVSLKKLHLSFHYDFYIKEEKGDTFISCKHNHSDYTYNVEKVTFAADNIYLGDNEASAVVIPILNENWKFIMQAFGKSFMDIASDIIYQLSHRFFDRVPTKYYIIEDLTSYVSNPNVNE